MLQVTTSQVSVNADCKIVPSFQVTCEKTDAEFVLITVYLYYNVDSMLRNGSTIPVINVGVIYGRNRLHVIIKIPASMTRSSFRSSLINSEQLNTVL